MRRICCWIVTGQPPASGGSRGTRGWEGTWWPPETSYPVNSSLLKSQSCGDRTPQTETLSALAASGGDWTDPGFWLLHMCPILLYRIIQVCSEDFKNVGVQVRHREPKKLYPFFEMRFFFKFIQMIFYDRIFAIRTHVPQVIDWLQIWLQDGATLCKHRAIFSVFSPPLGLEAITRPSKMEI